MSERKKTMTADPANCRHEYVRIYQRKLKGVERRLLATKAYLPVGFKIQDFSHLQEGSYCFCTACRTRLFPKRSPQEKAALRQAMLEKKQATAKALLEIAESAENIDSSMDNENDGDENINIDVKEFDLEIADIDDFEAKSDRLVERDENDSGSDEDL